MVPFLRWWTIALLLEIAGILGLSWLGYVDAAADFSAITTPTILVVFIVIFVVGVWRRK